MTLARLPATGRRACRFAVTMASLVMAGCNDEEPPIDGRIWRMVRCIECRDNEQADVVAMGESAIPGLKYLLLHGPPDSTLARQDSAIGAPYYAGGATTVVPPANLIELALEDFKARYRIRSGLALGLIGTDSARRVLCEGKAMQFRADVKRFIDSSLALLNGTCP